MYVLCNLLRIHNCVKCKRLCNIELQLNVVAGSLLRTPVGPFKVKFFHPFQNYCQMDVAIAEGFVTFSSEDMVVSPDPAALVDELSRRCTLPKAVNPEINEAF